MKILFWVACCILLSFPVHSSEKPEIEEHSAEIVVYGGTSAGVIAAVKAAKLGRSVLLVSPDKHLGGMSSSVLVSQIAEIFKPLAVFLVNSSEEFILITPAIPRGIYNPGKIMAVKAREQPPFMKKRRRCGFSNRM